MFFFFIGFFGFGLFACVIGILAVPLIVFVWLIIFSVVLGSTGVVTYIVDCHREKAGEAFAVMNFVKNLFAFGLSFYINDWLGQQGIRNCFFTIGGITMGVTLFTIPM